MITVGEYFEQNMGVFGLGKAGDATVASLVAGGAHVYAWDDGEASREALAQKFPKVMLLPIARWPWQSLRALVLSPGIPLTHPAPHPVVRLAQEANCPIIGDIELLWRACPDATYVGITGTNGKSTTTALTAHILKTCGLKVAVGGNLGTPALSLEALGKGGVYVLELSSYQLDLVRNTRFHVAALLNITPDHLDRHGNMEGYIAAKMHIFERQQMSDAAVIAVEDDYTRRIARTLEDGTHHVLKVVAQPELTDEITTLPGRHNAQNAAVAFAIARALGVQKIDIMQAMRSFPGLAHRLEQVATLRGVRYVNDSKATNADATSHALAAYDNIYWILGGKSKAGGIESLTAFFSKIRHAFLIGAATEEFASTLEGKVPYTRCGTLEAAVRAAAQQAEKGGVVLLSPACASFDQFKSFEERGDRFRELVNSVSRPSSATGSTHAA